MSENNTSPIGGTNSYGAILTRQRREGDWIAFLGGNIGIYEAAPTEIEAIGKLVISAYSKQTEPPEEAARLVWDLLVTLPVGNGTRETTILHEASTGYDALSAAIENVPAALDSYLSGDKAETKE